MIMEKKKNREEKSFAIIFLQDQKRRAKKIIRKGEIID
jgi:hypothetical protein